MDWWNVIWLQDHHMITHCFVMITPRYIITWSKWQEVTVVQPLFNPINKKLITEVHGWNYSHSMLLMTIGKQKLRSNIIYFILEFERIKIIVPLKSSLINNEMLMFQFRNVRNTLPSNFLARINEWHIYYMPSCETIIIYR